MNFPKIKSKNHHHFLEVKLRNDPLFNLNVEYSNDVILVLFPVKVRYATKEL